LKEAAILLIMILPLEIGSRQYNMASNIFWVFILNS
jgi:hypothetical protein